LLELWSIGRYDLKLSDSDFWGLSFKEFDTLRARQAQAERREWERAALVVATIFNVNRAKNRRALKVDDIIGKDPFKKKRRQTAREMLDALRVITILNQSKK
jgi:hypothetical protein